MATIDMEKENLGEVSEEARGRPKRAEEAREFQVWSRAGRQPQGRLRAGKELADEAWRTRARRRPAGAAWDLCLEAQNQH